MSINHPPRPSRSWPGVYNHTKFRSQLEIAFVKALDERAIRWFYEPERIADARYLIDFYVPDFKLWVEVKGQVSSRDHLGLRQAAEWLLAERKHRVFMYTATRAYLVTDCDFKPLTHDAFWGLFVAP
jgi:hypothetical protein